ncbi:MAG: hypothetical protein M1817_003217 [Caeruleum heppii]|nr:MAG: hypothetical protein M1817_003217 [Caeruleum heppii]
MAEAEQRSSHHLRNQETFAQSVRAFQEELLQDLKSAGNAVKTTFGKLLEEVNSAVQSLTVKVRANAQAAESDLDVLNDNIKMSANDISDLRAQLAFVFQELLRGGSELASSQQQEGEVALRTASDIRQYLAAISDEDVRYLEVAFGRFRSHLDWSLDSLRSLHTRQMVLEERLTNFDEAFGIIEQKADAFQTSQDRHASTQLEMQQSFQSHMYLTHDILDRMAASAHSLRTTVDETSEKVKQMGLLNGLGVFLGGWGWLLIIVFGLNMLNKAVAGYVAVATGIVYLIASADLGSSFVHHLNVRTTKLSSLSRTNGDLLFHGGTERGVAAAFGLALLVAGGYLIGRLIRVHCPNIGLSRALQRIRRTTGGKRTAGKHNGEKAKSKAFEGLLKSSHDHV